MIGSFHEFHDSMYSSRRYSTAGIDANVRSTIDENSSYEDLLKVWIRRKKNFIDKVKLNLFKEIINLRKEKEQDKQTIKLLQEQMVC